MNFINILENTFLTEMMIPMNYSYKDWMEARKKGMSPKKYHLENPSAKWRIVHCNKQGEIGKPIKGSSSKSYQDALKMHKAIQFSKG